MQRSGSCRFAVLVCLTLVLGGLSVGAGVRAAGPSPQAFAAEPSPEIEPNDTAATATLIGTQPARIRGGIDPSLDVDVYRLEGTAGSRLYAAVTTAWTFNASDSVLDLIGA